MHKLILSILILFLYCASIFAQSNLPAQIKRGNGSVTVETDGTITLKPAPGKFVNGVTVEYQVRLSGTATGFTNKNAILTAINSLPSNGGRITLSSGSYPFEPMTLTGKRGLILEGGGVTGTNLNPTTGGVAGILFVNARDCIVRDLRISGNTASPLVAGIEVRSSSPRTDSSMMMRFHDLLIGSDTGVGIVDGIKFDAPQVANGDCGSSVFGCDQNNEQAEIEGVEVRNYSGAYVHIQGANSLIHRIRGGQGTGGAIGVRLEGGSFKMSGTNFIGLSDCLFVFNAPLGTLEGNNGYFHPSFADQVSGETNTNLIRTATGTTVQFYLDHFSNKFTTSGDVIDFRGGILAITNSWILSGSASPRGMVATSNSSVILRDSFLEFQYFNLLGPVDAQNVTGNYGPAPATLNKSKPKTVNVNYPLAASDSVLLVDASGGARAITAQLSTLPCGFTATIKKIDSSANAVTVADVGGSNGIEYGTVTLPGQFNFVTITSNKCEGGAANPLWYIIARNP